MGYCVIILCPDVYFIPFLENVELIEPPEVDGIITPSQSKGSRGVRLRKVAVLEQIISVDKPLSFHLSFRVTRDLKVQSLELGS